VAQNSAAQPARVPEEPLLDPIERLSALIAARDQELRRLREELAARDLYIDQLHAVLRRQAERLERIEQRVRNLVPRPEP
jgi:septal ring factor EnvC (AmiA/AmiB activator)